MANRAEIPYGTLDLMVLKTLETLGPQHGYGIARRIEQVAESALELNQGTIYPALLRLEQKGWIASEWGASENNRKARFYSITRTGRKQLAAETESWSRTLFSGCTSSNSLGLQVPTKFAFNVTHYGYAACRSAKTKRLCASIHL